MTAHSSNIREVSFMFKVPCDWIESDTGEENHSITGFFSPKLGIYALIIPGKWPKITNVPRETYLEFYMPS
jgi:hypothetical protein